VVATGRSVDTRRLADRWHDVRYLALCGRFSRDAYCYVPAEAPFDLDALATADEPERWTDRGEPAIYLAGDVGVALAELGRHAPQVPPDGDRRRWRLVCLRVSLDRVLDLTRPETLQALGIEGAPWVFTEPARARAVARQVRDSGDCDAILVPSVAFLDQPDRWNVVIFVDRVRGGIRAAVDRTAAAEDQRPRATRTGTGCGASRGPRSPAMTRRARSARRFMTSAARCRRASAGTSAARSR
jgi:RES domain-containing protein